jgi:hypothetical protein
MSAKKLGFVMIAFGVSVALTGSVAKSARILDGPLGGPIIVVQPDPEPNPVPKATALKSNRCLASPCWYAGWSDPEHWNNLPDVVKDIGNETPPKIPYFWNHDASIVEMQVTPKSAGPVYARKLELTIDSKVLVIEMGKDDDPPKWTFDQRPLAGKLLRPRRNWPKALLGKITKVKVTESDQEHLTREFDFADLEEIRIEYNQ